MLHGTVPAILYAVKQWRGGPARRNIVWVVSNIARVRAATVLAILQGPKQFLGYGPWRNIVGATQQCCRAFSLQYCTLPNNGWRDPLGAILFA